MRRLPAALALLALLAGPAEATDTLNIYNWSDYIGEDTVARFEKETGITVRYDVYDSNDTLQAKMLAGSSGYDIVVPSSNFLARQIQAGAYRKLDRNHIPNWKNLDPALMKIVAGADPDNAYGVPWAWITIGIGYDEAKLRAILGPDAPLDRWDLVFDPAILAKLKPCGVSILDEPSDVLPPLLHYLGKDPNSPNPADYPPAFARLEALRPFVTKFNSSGYINDLANGDACLVLGYSADINIARRRAREAGRADTIRYVIPAGGAPVGFDMMVIPKDAPRPDLAERWIDFIERPEVNAKITDRIDAPTANAAARPFVDPAVANDPTIYPPPAVIASLFLLQPLPAEVKRLETRLWTKLKTGR